MELSSELSALGPLVIHVGKCTQTESLQQPQIAGLFLQQGLSPAVDKASSRANTSRIFAQAPKRILSDQFSVQIQLFSFFSNSFLQLWTPVHHSLTVNTYPPIITLTFSPVSLPMSRCHIQAPLPSSSEQSLRQRTCSWILKFPLAFNIRVILVCVLH